MISDQDVWLVWSSAFLVPWLATFVAFPHYRQPMVWASICTAPLGLTEPLFVPAYWSPPSLLNLSRTTGFDIESLIFSFAIGGIGAVLYDIIAGRVLITVPPAQCHAPRHKLHYRLGVSPFTRERPLMESIASNGKCCSPLFCCSPPFNVSRSERAEIRQPCGISERSSPLL